MEITEVRVKLVPPGSDKLRAFCSITIDNNFVVRDLKIIEGTKGPFVAMPSRKLTDRCPRCGGKNHHRATYCNNCGAKLPEDRLRSSDQSRAKLHADIAHPINSECREMIQRRVLGVYQQEQARSGDPDYTPASLDDFETETLSDFDSQHTGPVGSNCVRTGAGAEWPRDGALSGAGQARDPAGERIVAPWKRDAGRESSPEAAVSGRVTASRSENPAWRESHDEGAGRPLPRERVAEGLELDQEPEDNFGAGLFS